MTDLDLGTDEARVSYGIGFNTGAQIMNHTPPYVQVDYVIAGMIEAYERSPARLTAESLQGSSSRLQAQAESARRTMAKKASQSSADFLRLNAERDSVEELRSGVLYEVLTQGTGPTPTVESRVRLHYKGWLPDGRPLDSTTPEKPMVAEVATVLAGWRHALLEMPVGSKWMVFIPSELAHGSAGSGPIPPHSALAYELELLEVVA